MINSIFTKTLYDRRWFILGWSIALAGLTILLASFYPAMKISGLDELVANMPDAMKGLIGDLSLMNSFDTYMGSQLFDIRLPLITGIMAIILGLGLSSTEEESGELRTMLSLPISRTKLAFQKWLAIVVISLFMMLVIVASLYLTMPFVDGADMPLSELLPLLVASFALMSTFGSIVYAGGVISGKRAVAMALGVIVVIGSFILSTFGPAVDWLAGLEKLSLLYYFPANDIVKNGLNIPDISLLTGISLVLIIATLLVFRKRDIN